MRRFRLNEVGIALTIGLAIAALRLQGFRPIDLLELRALDYRLQQRDKAEISPDVVIVAVDDLSLERYGRWPWPRARVAELIEKISAAEPAVIGVDFVQSEASAEISAVEISSDVDESCRGVLEKALSAAQGSGDRQLADAVKASGRTVLGYFFDFNREAGDPRWEGEGKYSIVRSEAGGSLRRKATVATRNLPMLSQAARSLGYFNFFPDRDGLFRKVPLVIPFADRMVTPLSLTMLAVRWPDRPLAISIGQFGVSSVQFGSLSIPVAEDGQLLVNYRGPDYTFPHISAVEVLEGKTPAETFRDKLVLLGVTAIAVGDHRPTPLDSVFAGVEIHANVIDNIIRGDFVFQSASQGISLASLGDIAVMLLGSLLLAWALRFLRGVRAALFAAVIAVSYLVISQLLFTETGIALRVVYPSLVFALTYVAVSVQHYVAAERETRETRRVLDLYLSPSVARELSLKPEMLKLGGEKSERTVLFSDVREFTGISERLDPEELVELLNLYLGEMTDMVFAHDGMLDKYIGDGVMAVFGAPIPQADHALRACLSSLGMVERLRRVNEHGAQRGWPGLEMRIGLNTGQMVFGNMGSARHLSLTVMGDNVNLGARLEGINKLYGSTIIASESTVVAAGGGIVTRELDMVRVKGRTQYVRIFEVLDTDEERQRWARLVETFAAGLEAYRARRWEQAVGLFTEALAERAEDGPSKLYLRRARQYAQERPAGEWEAVTIFE